MPHMPNDSAIKVDKTLEEQLNSASFEEMKSILANAAVDQKLVTRDYYSPDVLIPTELANAAPKSVAKVIVFNGMKHVLEASDEAGLLAQENAIYRKAMTQPVETTQDTPPRHPETGRFVKSPAEQGVSDEKRADLDLRFQLGQLSAADYIEQSGAVADYLERQGIPLDDLKASVAEKQDARYQKSWEEATEEFKNGAGADWPGGQRNLEIAGNLLRENGLEDKPSVETLAAVWEHMKKYNLAVPNEELVQAEQSALLASKINDARSPSELAAILRPRGSSIFG